MLEIKKIISKTLNSKTYDTPIKFTDSTELFEYLLDNPELLAVFGSDVFMCDKLIGNTCEYSSVLGK